MPPTTRSSPKNYSPENQENFDSPKPSRKALRRGFDVIDNFANEQYFLCKMCNIYLKLSSLNSKELESVREVRNCYWLCGKCQNLSLDKKSLCFLKIHNGGFFDPSENSSSEPLSQGLPSFSDSYNFLKRCILNESLSEFLDTVFDGRRLSYIFLPILFLLASLHFAYNLSVNDTPASVSMKVKIEESFKTLENDFPQQDINVWTNFISGFTNLATNNDSVSPAVFLILHSNDTKTSFCIIKQVSKLAHEHLKFTSEPLTLDGANFENRYPDYGEFIVNVQEDIQSRKIAVIKNLHKFPGSVAQAFHGLTDEDHPLVEKVIYLMSIPWNESLYSDNRFEFAENILYESWRDIKGDTLGPLVTRLTTNVVQIKDENRFPSYC